MEYSLYYQVISKKIEKNNIISVPFTLINCFTQIIISELFYSTTKKMHFKPNSMEDYEEDIHDELVDDDVDLDDEDLDDEELDDEDDEELDDEELELEVSINDLLDKLRENHEVHQATKECLQSIQEILMDRNGNEYEMPDDIRNTYQNLRDGLERYEIVNRELVEHAQRYAVELQNKITQYSAIPVLSRFYTELLDKIRNII